VGFIPHRQEDMAEAFIEVPIIGLKKSATSYEYHTVIYNYYKSELVLDQSHQSVLVWDSAPTLDQLIQAYRVSSQKKTTYASPFWGLYKAVRAFAEEYCSVSSEMPLVNSLLNSLMISV
jgi:hypothetical protein